jgi:hypothetical protein
MATETTGKSAPKAKIVRAPIVLSVRMIDQLSRAALTKKITLDELVTIEAHIGKLKSLLS